MLLNRLQRHATLDRAEFAHSGNDYSTYSFFFTKIDKGGLRRGPNISKEGTEERI